MKKILIILLFLVNTVYAYQDAYITLDNKGVGFCMAIDDINNVVCNNQTIGIEGTEDHTVYIIPQTDIRSNDTHTTKFKYLLTGIVEPLLPILFTLILFSGMLLLAYGIKAFLRPS